MVKQYKETEKILLSKFDRGTTFLFNGSTHIVEFSGKPHPNDRGECKTDLFIKTKTKQNREHEIKISIKQENADFLENKITLHRAKSIFGPTASNLISESIKNIEHLFKDQNLIQNSVKFGTLLMMGWKCEIFNKSRKLSGEVLLETNLRHDALKEIYSGQRLDQKKKNAKVDGKEIKDSGVAEYILFVDQKKIKEHSSQDCIDKMQEINSYVKGDERIYLGFTALNYRVKKDKWDGDRPLCVWVDWNIRDKFLVSELKFDNPLEIRGNYIGGKIRKVLEKLQLTEIDYNEIIQHYKIA